jgi:hypothetical protein
VDGNASDMTFLLVTSPTYLSLSLTLLRRSEMSCLQAKLGRIGAIVSPAPVNHPRSESEVLAQLAQKRASFEQLMEPENVSQPPDPAIPKRHIIEHSNGSKIVALTRSFEGNMFTMFRQYQPSQESPTQGDVLAATVFDPMQADLSICKVACSCICHKRTKLSTPAILSGFVGSLLVGYTGLPFSPRSCNERTCKGNQHGSAHITYLFPQWLIPRLISLTYSQRVGFGVVLKAPRIVSDDALVLRYAASGDIPNMKLLFSQGLASPQDVGTSYGMTPLHVSQ